MVNDYWHTCHDYFNLIVLPLVIFSNLLYLSNDDHFVIQFCTFLCYIAFDTLWLIFIPQSVASPGTIIIHHLVCILGWSLPVLTNQFYLMNWASSAVLVEINTWFLIARRQTPHHSLLFTACSIAFNATWLIFRLGLYPMLWHQFGNEIFYPLLFTWLENDDISTFPAIPCVLWILLTGLNGLNIFWTLQMLPKLGRRSLFKQPQTKGL